MGKYFNIPQGASPYNVPAETNTSLVSAGKSEQYKLAASDHLPVDAFGFPVGKSIGEVVKVIKAPPGIGSREWQTALEVAVEFFRLTSGLGTMSRENLEGMSVLRASVWDVLYDEKNLSTWMTALALKGVVKKGSGLTLDQLRTLRYLTDVTVHKNLSQKLRVLGISWEVYQNWMKDAKFREQYKARAEDILDEVEAPVMMQVTKGALEGKLENIKYFHQLTGRFDPDSDAKSDVKAFLSGLIEILQGEIRDPELLKVIATRLQNLKDRTLGS